MSRQTKRRILTVLIAANLALIWGNSLTDGDASGGLSGRIAELLGTFLPFFATQTGHTLLRKAAHFSEFCLLGIFTDARRRLSDKSRSPAPVGFGLAVACIDETIQLFVPGRAGSLIDVWIDTAGFSAGLLLMAAGYALVRTTKQSNNYHNL